MTLERLYTVPEVADTLRVSRQSIYRWINAGKIKIVHVGSAIRVSESAVRAFIREAPDMSSKAGPDEGSPIQHENTPELVAA